MPRAARLPIDQRVAHWARLGTRARDLLDEIDVYVIEQEAGEDIWRSIKWWGRPDYSGCHPITCTCADCT